MQNVNFQALIYWQSQNYKKAQQEFSAILIYGKIWVIWIAQEAGEQ